MIRISCNLKAGRLEAQHSSLSQESLIQSSSLMPGKAGIPAQAVSQEDFPFAPRRVSLLF